MVRLAERLVGVDRGDGLTIFEQLLEPEEMPVDAMPVRGPRSVLEVARDRLAEERCAVLILDHTMSATPMSNTNMRVWPLGKSDVQSE